MRAVYASTSLMAQSEEFQFVISVTDARGRPVTDLARNEKVYITMTSANQGLEGLAQINTNRQALIGIPATELTGGRYEALAISSRLSTLLPEFGREIGALHVKHANQAIVTGRRHTDRTGPLQNPRIEVTRSELTGQVSLDGLP